jgi:hypothetical protein
LISSRKKTVNELIFPEQDIEEDIMLMPPPLKTPPKKNTDAHTPIRPLNAHIDVGDPVMVTLGLDVLPELNENYQMWTEDMNHVNIKINFTYEIS